MSDILTRFFDKVDQNGPIASHMETPCWIWTASSGGGDYPKFSVDGRLVGAYRWSYEHFVGPIPDGLSIDHKCLVRRCVNPEHLRPATRREQHENLSGASSNSKSGIRGVRWTKNGWEANVKVDGEVVYLGRFQNIDDAEQAAIDGRNKYFTHNELDRNK